MEQLNQGEEYYQLRRVYQYILINSDNDKLINEYAFRNKDNQLEEENLNIRYYVYMKRINEIVREKKLS